MKANKYIFIQNLIAPYRVSLFNALKNAGLNFQVFYMRELEDDRSWKIDKNEMKYKYSIFKGLYFYFKKVNFHFHLNLKLIYAIYKSKNTNVILGGSWNDPNIMTLCILKRLGIIKNTFSTWSEANMYTLGAQKDNKVKYLLRKFIFNTVDGYFILPGTMAKLTLEQWGVEMKKVVYMPNTIDEDNFEVATNNIKSKNEIPAFLITARLVENLKGIINFFEAIGVDNIKKAKFYIAGEGYDKDLYEKYISDKNLTENIHLLGQKTASEMASLYASADVFLLPSFSDPSPLSIVEALKMKLPLLVSFHCGNHYEALQEGVNGYGFFPNDHAEIKEKYEKLLESSNLWDDYGRKSFEIYCDVFNKESVVKNVVSQLNDN